MTVNAIADASSLIVLARLRALWLLERVFSQVVVIPEVVSETVTRGKSKGYADADHIADALVAEKLTVISPSPVET